MGPMLCSGLSPLRFASEKVRGGFRPAGFQGLSGANSTWRSSQNPRKSLVLPDLRGERPLQLDGFEDGQPDPAVIARTLAA